MTLSRRQAAAGLLALGGAALPMRPALAQPVSQAPAERPIEETPTEIGTGRDGFEHMLAPVSV
ncbi:MAG: hypothetical protein ACXU9B_24110, partial [Reyranella sp.]